MPIADEEVKQWPAKIMIGTKNAFDHDSFYTYQKMRIGDETVYVCDKGSEWNHNGEVLMLRCERSQDGTEIWTAYDTCEYQDMVKCRQPVFRCVGANITEAGWHVWQTNQKADQHNNGQSVQWKGKLWAETRVF